MKRRKNGIRRGVIRSMSALLLAVTMFFTAEIFSCFTAADSSVSRFIVDLEPPVLTVITPAGLSEADPTYAAAENYAVTGLVSDADDDCRVLVNGQEAVVKPGGSWIAEISLTDGMTHVVEVVAVDSSGNTTKESRYVRYDSSIVFEDFTVTRWNRSMVGYTADVTELVIPETFYDGESNTWYRVVAIGFAANAGTPTVSKAAFAECTNLISVTIPGSVKEIKRYSFYKCTGLKNLIMGEGLEFIDMGTFQYCSALSGKLILPNTVTTLGSSAFAYDSSLTSVSISDSLPQISPHAFLQCTGLSGELIIPDSVVTIKTGAFAGCSGLTRVVIPDDVTAIATDTFESCRSLSSVVIPAGVTYIGENAFYRCDSLSEVYYKGTEEQWNAISIGTENEDLTGAVIQYRYGAAEE